MDKYWEGYGRVDDHGKPVYVLKNWGVRGEPDPYRAPEITPSVLCGDVYHHPDHKDGTYIITSKIVNSLDTIVETLNSYYELKEPCVTYTLWCESKGITIDPDNPVIVKD